MAGRTPSGGNETQRAELPYHPESSLTQGTGRSNSTSSGTPPRGLVIGHSVNDFDAFGVVDVEIVVLGDIVTDDSWARLAVVGLPSEDEHATSATTSTATNVSLTVMLSSHDRAYSAHAEGFWYKEIKAEVQRAVDDSSTTIGSGSPTRPKI